MEVSEGGIVIPESAQRPEITGILLGKGEEVPETFPAKENDVVIFPQYAGTEVELEDDEGKSITLLFMPYDRIVGLVEEADRGDER